MYYYYMYIMLVHLFNVFYSKLYSILIFCCCEEHPKLGSLIVLHPLVTFLILSVDYSSSALDHAGVKEKHQDNINVNIILYIHMIRDLNSRSANLYGEFTADVFFLI